MFVIVCSAVALLVGGFCGFMIASDSEPESEPLSSPYATRLGRTCWVRDLYGTEYVEHVCVAASWRGAVCVRRADNMDGNGFWIKKENVAERVRWTKEGADAFVAERSAKQESNGKHSFA